MRSLRVLPPLLISCCFSPQDIFGVSRFPLNRTQVSEPPFLSFDSYSVALLEAHSISKVLYCTALSPILKQQLFWTSYNSRQPWWEAFLNAMPNTFARIIIFAQMACTTSCETARKTRADGQVVLAETRSD